MLIGYIISEVDENRLIYLKAITRKLIENNVLESPYKKQYFEKLDNTDFNSVINFYGENIIKYNRIINELESWQYEQQNPVIDYLRDENSMSFLNSLEIVELFYLGRLLKDVASGGHWKTQYFISAIISGTKEMPDYLKAGLAYSAFISRQDKYSLSEEFVLNTVKLLNQIDILIQDETYGKIINVLKKDTPNSWDKDLFNEASLIKMSEHVFENIDKLKDENKENFEKLIIEIKKYFA